MSPTIQAAIAELEAKRRDIELAIDTLRSLSGVPASTPALPGKKPRACVKSKPSKPKTVEVAGKDSPSPLRDAVIHALRHKPLTSIQTFDVVIKNGMPNTTSGSVYQTLRVLAEKGAVERVQTEEGTTAWRLLPV